MASQNQPLGQGQQTQQAKQNRQDDEPRWWAQLKQSQQAIPAQFGHQHPRQQGDGGAKEQGSPHFYQQQQGQRSDSQLSREQQLKQQNQ